MILLLLLLLLGGVLSLSAGLLRRFGFSALTYTLSFSEEEVTEGDTVYLTETICSAKLLPLPWVKAELTTASALQFASGHSSVSEETRFVSSFFSLRPYRKIERRWKVICTQRGEYTVSHAVLILSDLFGAGELSQAYPDAAASVRVLPAVRELSLPDTVPEQLTGELIRPRSLMPDRLAFCGIRPYADGDPLRDICWSATARMGSPMIRQFHETISPGVTVLFNVQTRETDREQTSDRRLCEAGIRLCASVLHDAAMRRIPVRFCANTEIGGQAAETLPDTGAGAVLRLRRLLSALPYTISGRFSELVRQVCQHDPASSLIVITALPDAELLSFAAAEPRLTVLSLRRLPRECSRRNVLFVPPEPERSSA